MEPVRVLRLVVFLSSAMLAGCPEEPVSGCPEFDEVFVWADSDEDGFGTEPIGWVCEAGPHQATNGVDCDDEDPTVSPAGEELCDLIDNDCDGAIDETVAKKAWYPDADGDGFGNIQNADFACLQPSDIHLEVSGDCDDGRADVNPTAVEVCNEIDDDCDTLVDDADGGIDPESRTQWYRDIDLDGFGDPDFSVARCVGPANSSQLGTDCDDDDPLVNPSIVEICNEIDDDCDTLVDDYDDYVDPTTQTEFFNDADLDGYGDATQMTLSCAAVNGATDNDLDCDDNDPLVTIPTDWYIDIDGDTYGSGNSVGYGCFPPIAGVGPGVFGIDCDETDVNVNPGAEEICGDGIDNDCSGADQPCGPIGSYYVESGPNWTLDPPVYSCIEACASIFGGVPADYACSTDQFNLNHRAYMSGWGDGSYCSGLGHAEDYSLEPVGNPGYNCGGFGCAYSAYVQDNCFGSRNWCWLQ